jgi:hypothetical protein
MDAPNLLLAMIVVGLLLVVAPRVAVAAGPGEIVAQLFVPPDRSLGWPHGVQESDEPWGWHPGAPEGGSEEPDDAEPRIAFDLVDVVDLPWSGDALVVEVRPVPATRPHRLAA